jgi:hypothetical protein
MFSDVWRHRLLRERLWGTASFVVADSEPLDFWIPFNDFNLPETTGGAQCVAKGLAHANHLLWLFLPAASRINRHLEHAN